MEKITSFCINHDILEKGLYISRIDGDIITYDMRMVKPNGGVYLDQAGLHTFEHLLATFMRNSSVKDDIVYAGPMGCRTGFYLLTRDHLKQEKLIAVLKECMAYIAAFEGEIPGAQASAECGNVLEHDLTQAKQYAKAYGNVIAHWTEAQLAYPEVDEVK